MRNQYTELLRTSLGESESEVASENKMRDGEVVAVSFKD